MEYSRNKDGKFTAIGLVSKFFGATMAEMKDLPATDRNQLASAIARQEGIAAEECSFPLVAY